MKHLMFLSIAVLMFGCKPASHKVTFDFKIQSTNGKQPLIMECYNAKDLLEFVTAQNKAFMESKPQPKEVLKPVAKYDSKSTPEHEFKFMLELPEDEVTCGVGPFSFVTVRVGDKSGQVFKPLADTTVKVSYNMFTKSFYQADSTGAKIEIIK